MDGPVLSDGVLHLRCLMTRDAAEHLAGEDDDAIRWHSDAAATLEEVEAWIARSQDQLASSGPVVNLGVWEMASARLIGNVESSRADPSLDPGEVNISYVVFPPWRGRGYGARSVELMVGYLARDAAATAATTAVIRVDAANDRSVAVAERTGFRRDGSCRAGDGSPLLRYVRPLG